MPDTITSIGNYAFKGCKSIASITLSKAIVTIGISAFEGCTSLSTIEIPEGATTISASAFYGCTGLSSIVVPSTITSIGKSAFYNCTSLSNITIPKGISTIEASTFYNCTSLTSIIIPEGVISIGESAFEKCTVLTSVEIPTGVTNIGKRAFANCSALSGITIPSGVTSIGNEAFLNCKGLSSIVIPNGVSSIGTGTFSGCTSLTGIEIPESVTGIGESAFQNCTSLSSMTIPTEVTAIGNYAFKGCNALASVTMSNKISIIGTSAFEGCSNLNSIEIPESVTTIKSSAFKGCKSLTSIVIPTGVTSIEASTFEGCTNLSSVTISDNVISIGNSAFYKCINLTNIEIPSSVTTIYAEAFYGCTNLSAIEIPQNVTTIGNGAFYGCTNLSSVTISEGVTKIGDEAFRGCTSLLTIALPEGLQTVEDSVFYGCTNLTSVKIPEGVTKIESNAFYNCSRLTSIEIPKGVTSIGSNAFYGCKALSSITMEEGLTSIGAYAFKGCTNLTSIVLPSGVVSIGNYIFEGCTGLTSITLSDTLTTVGTYAFKGCTGLTTIIIPEGVTKIGEATFYGCTNLTNIILPTTLTSIGKEAFKGCKSLTSVEVPEGTTTILANAFEGCTSLISVSLPTTLTSIGAESFKGCTTLPSLEIPTGVITIGTAAFSGCTNLSSLTISDTVVSIGSEAFLNCSKLTVINIPKSVAIIGSGAFNGCTSLTAINVDEENTAYSSRKGVLYDEEKTQIIKYPQGKIDSRLEVPSTVTKIESQAFYGNKRLYIIAIPDNVTTIASDSFKGCSNLTIYCRTGSYAEEYAIANGIPYVIDDDAPIISDVAGNPTTWVRENVILSIVATDEKVGLSEIAYSFDGGETWQEEATKTYTENQSGIIVKVKDALGNIATYEEINITKIDKVEPEITDVIGNPSDWTKEDVTLTIIADDEREGLAEEAYSFDGGVTWQATNQKVYTENTNNIVIKVKDAAGNIGTYETVINITKIDKTKPTITSVTGNPTTWTSEDVTLVVTANDAESGLEKTGHKAYSFDGGETWQNENSKTFEANTTEEIVIQVKDIVGNVTEYPETISITKIDKDGPEIVSVTGNATEWTKNNVTLVIKATDEASGMPTNSALYSFDGGATWQESNQKLYTENTNNIVIKVKDALGNVSTYEETINIDKIDKVKPEILGVSGNPTEWTSKVVTLTIVAEDNESELAEKAYSFDGGETWQEEATKTFSENTSGILVKVRDLAGNIATYSEAINITKIEANSPTIVMVEGNVTEWTQNDVTLKVTAFDSESGLAEKAYSFDGGDTWQASNEKTYTQNASNIIIQVRDTLGNIAEWEPINIEKIDKKAPTISSVTGNVAEWTKDNVTLTVEATDAESGMPEGEALYSFDGGATWQESNQKTFEGNAEEIVIQVKDAIGNIATYEEVVNIEKIDKEAPTITKVEKDKTEWTTETVTLTIEATDTASGLAEKAYSFDGGETWQEEPTKTYTENTNGIVVKVRDSLGNTATYGEEIDITNIEKNAPVIERIEGNVTEWTTSDVTLKIIANDTEAGLAEEAYSFDGGATWQESNEKTYTENTSDIVIKVRDKLGNTEELEAINIEKIDKEKPTIENIFAARTEENGNEAMLVVTAKDSISGLAEEAYSFDGGATWQDSNSKVIDMNIGTVEVQVKDKAGNITIQESNIEFEIDNTAPTINIIKTPETWTNGEVTLKIEAEDDLVGLPKEAYSFDGGETWETANEKTYTENTNNIVIKVRDILGNVGEKTIDITNIDKTAPEITSVTGNPTDWTAGNVILQINAVDNESGIRGQAYSFDGGATWQESNEKTYAENTKDIVIQVKDSAGNITEYSEKINITKIDKTKPEIASITGNPKNWTNKNVTLTINVTDSDSGLSEKAYSFDGGATWQETNTKEYEENTEGILIQVKDAVGNIAEYSEEISITKIDKIKPIIAGVTPDQESWINDITTLAVNATDEESGLADLAYSFDNGTTWKAENTQEYTDNAQGIVIMVKDNAGNVETYTTDLKLPKVLRLQIDDYKTENDEGVNYLINVPSNTTIAEVIEKIKTNGEITVYKGEETITDTTQYIGTNMKIEIVLEENKVEYVVVVRGDASGDGKVDIIDILSINKHRLRKNLLEGAALRAGDITGDKEAALDDIFIINKYRLGKIQSI